MPTTIHQQPATTKLYQILSYIHYVDIYIHFNVLRIFLILQLLSTHFFSSNSENISGWIDVYATCHRLRNNMTTASVLLFVFAVKYFPLANEYLNRNGREYIASCLNSLSWNETLQGSYCNHAVLVLMYLLALGLIGSSSTAGHSKRWHYQNSSSQMYIYIFVLLFKKRV